MPNFLKSKTLHSSFENVQIRRKELAFKLKQKRRVLEIDLNSGKKEIGTIGLIHLRGFWVGDV